MTDSSRQHRPMGLPARDRDGKRRKAASFFTHEQARKASTYQQMQTDRVIAEAKTAKLRALRLAKEEVDRQAARVAAAGAKTIGTAAK